MSDPLRAYVVKGDRVFFTCRACHVDRAERFRSIYEPDAKVVIAANRQAAIEIAARPTADAGDEKRCERTMR